ncbi:alanine--tRNA ligase, partial [Patescibacteria group bacterium]|nr:alanine--tRNA ligase [Patescibacteria group bacterium]
MTTDEVRRKYLEFFKSGSRNHKEISPASLVPQDDPSTLFTSSGMQQLIPNLMGEEHPEGKRLVNSQPCIRVQDIEEVGDNRHTTFFEMLGNWSLGDYFKDEQLSWFLEFLTEEIGLPKEKLWISVFEGNKFVPKDEDSAEIWEKLGIPKKRIHYYDATKNWWSRSGTPNQMPINEIGGPDSEVFFEFTQVKHNPEFGKVCHPNCDCGRFLEIGNSVFIQYIKQKDGSLKELSQKNVDFGGGLERIVVSTNNEPDIFKIDIFQPIIGAIRKEYFTGIYDPVTMTPYYPTSVKLFSESKEEKLQKREVKNSVRVVADHLRASVFLGQAGIVPSNKQEGYIMRRLIRRSIFELHKLGLGKTLDSSVKKIASAVFESYEAPILDSSLKTIVVKKIVEETIKFARTLDTGIISVDHDLEKGILPSPEWAFNKHQSLGMPLEVTEEIMSQHKKVFNDKDRQEFEKLRNEHKEKSRIASVGMFKGGLADSSEKVTKLHTTTHLLHSALRKVLGETVQQKGSNITAERLRFDFSHSQKLTEEEIEKVESLINEQIKKDLPVTFET